MRQAISNFAGIVAGKGPDTVALLFYAGHGLQVDGENFLVPIDARIQREADVPLQAMRNKARIVILDACRNNPFSDINKTTGRGLTIVDAPTGSLVSHSTAPAGVDRHRGLPRSDATRRRAHAPDGAGRSRGRAAFSRSTTR